MRLFIASLSLAAALSAQPVITATAPVAFRGGTATVTVTVSGTSAFSGIQFFLPQLPGVAYTATAGPVVNVGFNFTCAVSPGALFGCIADGSASISNGVVATITFPAPPVGAYSLPITFQAASDVGGNPVTVALGAPLTLTVAPSPCDLNSDGVTDATDVGLAIAAAIQRLTTAALDITSDGVVNVVDVQRVLIASKGGVCRVGP